MSFTATTLKGIGKVVLTTAGLVEDIQMKKRDESRSGRESRNLSDGWKIHDDNSPDKNYLGRFASGGEYLRVFEGSGRLNLDQPLTSDIGSSKKLTVIRRLS